MGTVWRAGVLSFVIVAGCQGKEEPAKPESKPAPAKPAPAPVAPAKTPMTAEQAGARWIECMGFFSAHDAAKFGGCVGERTTSEMLDAGMPVATGSAAMVERAKGFWTGFPDITAKPQLVLLSGGQFATIDLMTGTNTGSFMGMPATGKKIGNYAAHLGELDLPNGEAKVINGLVDMGTLMGQVMGDKKARPVVEQGWPDAGKIVIAKDDATERANVDAFKAATAAFNAHDAKLIEAYADDAVLHDVGMGDLVGKKAIATTMKGFWAGFSDLKTTEDRVWGAGDWVFMAGTTTGTNDGDLKMMGIKKTGKPITLRTVEFARYEGGKVKDHWVFYNGMAMAMQLGLVPPPGAAPAPAMPAKGGR